MAHAETRHSRVSSGDLPYIDALEDPEELERTSSRRVSREDGEGGGGSRRSSRSPAPAEEAPSRRADAEGRASSRRSSRSPAPEASATEDQLCPSRRTSRATDGEDASHSRRSSRSPIPVITTGDLESEPLIGSRKTSRAGSDRDDVSNSRRESAARSTSRRSSRTLLYVDDGRRRSSSRRGSSYAPDLAEVVLAELRRPTRRSSRSIALELGEIVSLEVRRESRPGSRRGSVVEEVHAQVTRQSVGGSRQSSRRSSAARVSARPSLLTQRGSVQDGSDAEDDSEEDDGEEDEGEFETTTGDEGDGSLRSAGGQLDGGSRVPQYVSAIVVNLASFCNGVSFGWPAIALPLLQSQVSPIGDSPMNDEVASWLVATMCISAAISTPVWTMLNDRYGRKNMGYLTGLFFGLHWIVLGVTRNTVCLFTARVFGGLAAAGTFVVCPTFVKEISEDAIRGEMGIIFTIMFNLGLLLAYSVGAAVSYKGVNIIGMTFVLLFVLAFWQIPESPVYLLSKGRASRAARSLQWFRGRGADIWDEFSFLRKANKRRLQEGDCTIFEIISDKASFRGLVITTFLCANNTLSGIPVVLSYAVSIFMEAGGGISPHMSTIIVGALLLVSSYVASHLVDRAGRKMMLIISNGGLAVCLISLGLYFFIKHLGISVKSLHLDWLPVMSLSMYVVLASLGVAPLPYVILTEMFLPRAQRIATTLGYVIIWSLSFFSMKFFTNIANTLGIFSCYWIFAAVCMFMCIFTHFYIPETKGRSLSSILDELSGVKKPRLIIEDKEKNNFGV